MDSDDTPETLAWTARFVGKSLSLVHQTRTLAKELDETMEEHGKRIEAFVEWFETIPLEHQEALIEKLDALYSLEMTPK